MEKKTGMLALMALVSLGWAAKEKTAKSKHKASGTEHH
jgi:hypothetical protein